MSNPYVKDLFFYENSSVPSFNGSISQIRDAIKGDTRTFSYDGAGRLTAVKEVQNSTRSTFTNTYTYDLNSNLKSIMRFGRIKNNFPPGIVDNLLLSYSGNRLRKVDDGAQVVLYEKSFDFHDGADNSAEYYYDSNGNLISDINRGFSNVLYNELNLPTRVHFSIDSWREYVYDGTGRKLRSSLWGKTWGELLPGQTPEDGLLPSLQPVMPSQLEVRDYAGNFELSDKETLRVYTPNGYFDSDGSFYAYLRDYQGNIRSVVYISGNKVLEVQHNEYYPYGLPTAETNSMIDNDYRYGGKEFDTHSGLNTYDFGARSYTPDIARFWQPDPMAHDYHWLSPYAYCGGDPINRIDPDGMKIYYIGMDGRIISEEEALVEMANGKSLQEIKDFDQIVIKDTDGNIMAESMCFQAGTIKLYDNESSELSGNDITLFEITGDNASVAIFELLANTITGSNNVEFGLNLMDNAGPTAKNDVFTTHKPMTLAGSNALIKMRYFDNRSFRELIHSHKKTPMPSSTDVNYMNALNKYLNKRNISPTYKIYNCNDKQYYIYNSGTKFIQK